MFARNTYLEIDLKNLKNNLRKILRFYDEYDYYFGVVKDNCYGQGGSKTIKTIIDSGCNYLAVSTLEEALDIRKKIGDIPILCMSVISSQYIETCVQNNVTITVNSLEYLEEILEEEPEELKVHIKVNTGMNRLGISSAQDLKKAIEKIKNSDMILEGIFTHIYDSSDEQRYLKQIELFKNITQEIDLSKIPIVHIPTSSSLTKYDKLDFVNGCRIGIMMYGFTEKKLLELQSTARLISEVVQINILNKGDTVGYDGAFEAKEKTKVAVISIGYADGIIRKNTGREVYINDKPYKIIGNICMDMLFVEVDDEVNIHDKVDILKDNDHIEKIAEYLDTIPYEVMSIIPKRVPRIYKNN